jgi:hypothetical protein
MANVKLSEKRLLEQLQAKLTLKKGKKISQQEILDKCIQFSSQNFEKFIQESFDTPKLNPDLLLEILNHTVSTGFHHSKKSDDELLYGR